MRVLVLNIDGLQPAYLGPYGCEWVPTPTLDSFSASGAVYDQHFADDPCATVAPVWRSQLIAELRAEGVRTARIGPGSSTKGWDVEIATKRDRDPLALKPARRAVRQAIERLGAANALLWVEIDAILPPWAPAEEAVADLFDVTEDEEPSEPWIEPLPESIAVDDDTTFDRLQRTYAAAVATLDVSLDKLLGDCRKRGWGDDSAWIVTSDRGFPLGEHGPVGFAKATLHEELVHLPLLVRRPNADKAGMRIDTFTQPIDLGALVRTLFRPNGAGAEPVGLERVVTKMSGGDRTLWGYRSRGWYLLLDDRPHGERRLFVKPDDRWEVNDVSARNQELVAELECEFRQFMPSLELG